MNSYTETVEAGAYLVTEVRIHDGICHVSFDLGHNQGQRTFELPPDAFTAGPASFTIGVPETITVAQYQLALQLTQASFNMIRDWLDQK